ncbi:universal stress protein [Terracidiphilus gabretensis]|jgi:nucleotide-binding universal stress UspA family protein|uniref:universal stress protein n=1 Tax=Terracidiphilus gabretensis TaxID=1577687 RepID=UPI00071B771F|nr:universal stress protein [Terracidiphilus gabretensis]
MKATWKPQWTRPATILFAATIPVNEKAFRFALAEGAEHKACLILFNAYDTMMASTVQASGIVYYDFDGARLEAKRSLEPLAERARRGGVPCRVEVRSGLPVDEILSFAREFAVDRIVMGTRSPGTLGKLFVGSVAEEVLRKSPVPVSVIGPNAVDGAHRHYAIRRILCGVSHLTPSSPVVTFAAKLAQQHKARLTLMHVIPEQTHTTVSIETEVETEHELLTMIPPGMTDLDAEAMATSGDPANEILYRARSPLVDLIVLSAHDASMLESVSRNGVVYKVIAGAECPVLTLSPAILALPGVCKEQPEPTETYLAGVF